jgi:phosphoglycolate phosphatase
MPAGILFDLDGTLLDSLGDLADAMNDALRSLALPTHPQQAFRRMVGDGARLLAERATPSPWRTDPHVVDTVFRRYVESYGRRWHLNSPPFAGIPELLDACTASRRPIAVLSNKPDVFTQQVVRTLLPRWPWAAIRGQSTGTPRKPSPDGALAVARDLGLDPADCLFVGDSGVDMACAAAAGMCGLGALWGYRDPAELTAAGARALLSHPSEVAAWLG